MVLKHRSVFLLFSMMSCVVRAGPTLPNPKDLNLPTEPIAAPPGYEISHLWQIMGYPSNQFLNPTRLDLAQSLGITSLVSYVHWSEVEPVGPYHTTFETYVTLRRKLREHGLRWTPILVANPFYSTPKWFRNSKESVFARCLAHDKETTAQSIWNPYLRPHLRRFMRKVAEFCHQRRDATEVVRLGICGNFGEATYPSQLGLGCPDSIHIHPGWWAGDRYARQDFRRWLKQRYGGAKGLATAWIIPATAVDQIATATGNLISLPQEALAGKTITDASGLDKIHQHRFLDFVTWYQDSMTRYAKQWMEDIREFFPGDRIELVLAGDGRPQLGANLVALIKTAKEYQAGVWYIGMSNDFLSGFPAGRLVSSAARGYGVPYGAEEVLPNKEIGIPGRFFDALSGGAKGLGFRGLFDCVTGSATALPLKALEPFCRYLPLLKHQKPVVPMTVFYPATKVRAHPRFLSMYQSWLKRLRDRYDFDLIDETMIRDGFLEHYRLFVCLPMCEPPRSVQKEIRRFVKEGGVEIIHAGLVDKKEMVDALGRTKTIVLHPRGKGCRAIYGLPTEREYSQFSPRLNLLLRGERMPWKGALSPDGSRDGVYSTLFSDGTVAAYNSLNLSAEVTLRLPGRSLERVRLDPLQLRLFSGTETTVSDSEKTTSGASGEPHP